MAGIVVFFPFPRVSATAREPFPETARVMATLVHGTTRARAERIVRTGPDPRYIEPGGRRTNDGFSAYLEAGPFLYDTPDVYARGKASQCPAEGGPVILVIESVPDAVLAAADPDGWFPVKDGLVQFGTGAGLEELLAVWPALPKTIRAV